MFLATFVSCSLREDISFDEVVKFNLPEETDWNVFYANDAQKETRSLTDADSFCTELEKNYAVPVIAYKKGEKNPVGTIYPYSTDLTEKNGFAAEVLYTLMLSSRGSPNEKKEFLCRFNWKRFMDECSKSEKSVWNFNKSRIMEKIANGTFTKTDLK